MDLKVINAFRQRLAFIIFGILIAWPIFHIIMVNTFRISSWRLFGWGMYATPNPEAQSRLRVIILNEGLNPVMDMAQIKESINELNLDKTKESLCINLFLKEPKKGFSRISQKGLCQNNAFAKDLDYFLHFGSKKHLEKIIKEALIHAKQLGSQAYALLTHQRFNLFQRKAYLESDIYKVSLEKVEYLGKIKNEG